MPVSTTKTKIQYYGNGVTTEFDTEFLFLANEHLLVYLGENLQVLNTQYTVSGANVSAGGTVTFLVPPASGVIVTILRSTPRTQERDFEPNGPLPSDEVEGNDNKLTLLVQEVYDQVNPSTGFSRNLQYPLSEPSSTSNILPSDRANKLLAFDPNGEPTAVVPTTAVLLDEDNMVSDSSINGATQQSIKAYVDGVSGRLIGKNLLINALGTINQRSYTSGTATSGANQYTLDRWRVVTSGQNLTFSTSANVTTFTAPAGGIEQVILGENIQSGTYVISWTGTATCTVDGVAKSSGDTFTLTGGTNCTVRFIGGTFSKPQVEVGSVVTSFDARPKSLELSLAEYYTEIIDIGASGGNSAEGNVVYGGYHSYHTIKRTTPSATQISGTFTNCSFEATINETTGKFTSVRSTSSGTWSYVQKILIDAEI